MAARYGISPDEFYRMNPKKLLRMVPYYEEQIKRKKEWLDTTAWLHGAYVAKAVSLIGGGSYPDSPLNVFGIQYKTDAETEEEQTKACADGFRAVMIAYNESMKRKKKLEESEVVGDV